MQKPFYTPIRLLEEDIASFLNHLSTEEVAVVIPAFNEERVLESSLKALTAIIPKEHIYVVSDGSTDRTAELATHYTENVLDLDQNYGKAKALEALIAHFDLTQRYTYLLFSDADSRLAPDFLEEIKKNDPLGGRLFGWHGY